MNVHGGTIIKPSGVSGGKIVSPVTLHGGALIVSPPIVDEYDGPMEVTPAAEPQTLPTNNKTVYGNIVVKAIPDYYGLITWNGSILTVS